MTNTHTLLSAYRAIYVGRLIGLEKCMGIQTVRIGDILQQMIWKCVLQSYGEDAAHYLGVDQL